MENGSVAKFVDNYLAKQNEIFNEFEIVKKKSDFMAMLTFVATNFFGNKEYWKEIFWPDLPVFLNH